MPTGFSVPWLDSNRPSTNDRELLLTQWSGEVETAFLDMMAVANKVRQFNIPVGAESQIIATGYASAERHVRGTETFGQDMRNAQRKVALDDSFLVSQVEWYDMDEQLGHFSLRAEHTRQMADALSRVHDLHALATLAKASLINVERNSGDLETGYRENSLDPKIGTPGGAVLVSDLAEATAKATRAVNLYDQIVNASEILDRKDVPKEGRWAIIPTNDWYALRYGRNTAGQFINLNIDYMGPSMAGKTDQVLETIDINGVKVYSSNRFLRDSVLNSNPSKYNMPFASLHGIVWQEQVSVALLKESLSMEAWRDERRMHDVVRFRMFEGHDVIRPECVVTIWDDAVATGSVIDNADVLAVANAANTAFNL